MISVKLLASNKVVLQKGDRDTYLPFSVIQKIIIILKIIFINLKGVKNEKINFIICIGCCGNCC